MTNSSIAVELRESSTDDSPGTIAGLILPVGRIAADRRKRSLFPVRLPSQTAV